MIFNWLKQNRRRIWILLVLIVLPVAGVFAIDWHVEASTKNFVFENTKLCPDAPIALLLGVAKKSGKHENLFYRPRLKAAAELYHSGKVRGIVISGDHGSEDYNEPETMKSDLIEMGIPAEHMTCDYAGFRTLDSIVRARSVFGQSRFIVVSQRFHCERAIFLARHLGCEAWGYAAKDVKGYWGRKVKKREILARAAAAFDLVVGTAPRFLGAQEDVGLKPNSTSD